MTKYSKTIFTVSASALLLFGTVSTAHADGHGERMNVPKIETTEFMTELANPWDMSFLPDGTMFFTEKCAGLSVREASGTVHKLYGVKGSDGYAASGDDLFCEGQAGVLGVAVDAKFADNRTLYLYSSSTKYHDDGCKTNFGKCDENLCLVHFYVHRCRCACQNLQVACSQGVRYRPRQS